MGYLLILTDRETGQNETLDFASREERLEAFDRYNAHKFRHHLVDPPEASGEGTSLA